VKRDEILEKARKAVGDRGHQYGEPEDNFLKIATLLEWMDAYQERWRLNGGGRSDHDDLIQGRKTSCKWGSHRQLDRSCLGRLKTGLRWFEKSKG
jgi:hypothetical protein